MINPKTFYSACLDSGISFFAGVPDSLLKDICAWITAHAPAEKHIITANEGGAVALAAGYHLATGNIPLVYFQNSGLGNATNPLLSLTSKEVYAIPMVLLIGWRGEPGVKDEPQHKQQGRVQNALLDAMEIPYRIIDGATENVEQLIRETVEIAKKESSPVALVVRANTFSSYNLPSGNVSNNYPSRQEAIDTIVSVLADDDVVVSTTGKASRELYSIRLQNGQTEAADFLTVGSMGHASHIALGIAMHSSKRVVCLDGDGAVLMHMGSLAINGFSGVKNFLHIVLNNAAHDSVGGQPTLGGNVSFTNIALACGYNKAITVSNKGDIADAIESLKHEKGATMVEVLIRKGSREDLPRPAGTPEDYKNKFMRRLKGS